MKKTHSTFLTLLFVIITLLIFGAVGKAAEDKTSNITDSNTPKSELKRPRPSADMGVDLTLNQLKKTDPERAKELMRLRTENPKKFLAEFGETTRDKVAHGASAFKQSKLKPASEPGAAKNMLLNDSNSQTIDPISRKYDEHLDWLKKNYPEQAKKLSELKNKQPNIYKEQIELSLRKYGAIERISKTNPQLAQVLKERTDLAEQKNGLLEKIKTTNDEGEKKKLTKELEEVISKDLALVAKKKEIENQESQKKLKNLQEEIKNNESEAKKWNSDKFRQEQVKTKVENLTSGKENVEQQHD